MPEDVSFPLSWVPGPGFQHHFLHAANWPGRTTLQQDPSAHIYSVLFLLVYISLVYISPNPGPLTLLYSQFPSMHSRPRHLTRHTASANQGSRGISPSKWILVHLHSSQDVCGLYEEVRCKSYDLAEAAYLVRWIGLLCVDGN